METCLASIIIPTNRGPDLATTLVSVCRQERVPNDFEVLVIENGAKSGAERIVEAVSTTYPQRRLRYVYEPTPGLLAGRHRGAVEAAGSLLIFVDDDIDVSPHWLESIVETFTDRTIDLIGGRILARYESKPPSWLQSFWGPAPHGGSGCGYLSLLDLGEQEAPVDANFVWGLNFSIRAPVLRELGGFHPDNLPDDLQHFQGDGETGLTIKANEAGLRAVYQPQALVHHRIPASRLTTAYFRRRAFYQGVCDSFTAIRRDPADAAAPALDPEPARAGFDATSRSRRRPVVSLFARKWRRSENASPERESTREPGPEDVHAEVDGALKLGFEFHRAAVAESSVLLEWVHRKDYWDYRMPDVRLSRRIRGIQARALARPH